MAISLDRGSPKLGRSSTDRSRIVSGITTSCTTIRLSPGQVHATTVQPQLTNGFLLSTTTVALDLHLVEPWTQIWNHCGRGAPPSADYPPRQPASGPRDCRVRS